MRVAFVGKGGAGKSTIVGAVARAVAREDEPVIVLDSDVMPGLAGALGMPFDDASIPAEAVGPGPEGGPRFVLRAEGGIDAVVERWARPGPDGVRLLQLGKLGAPGSERWNSQEALHAFDQIKAALTDSDWHVVADLPGGTRQAFMGWADFAETVLVVVEPTVKSFVTARRLRRLADGTVAEKRLVVIANKVEHASDVELIAAETGLEVIAAVPLDPAVRACDRDGVSLLDVARDAPATQAIRHLAAELRGRQEVLT